MMYQEKKANAEFVKLCQVVLVLEFIYTLVLRITTCEPSKMAYENM
jgi:hypothetical protein